MENNSICRFDNVFKKYDTGKVKVDALRGISFTINEGEFVSIAGPSGSGKTTILNLAGCLDKPTSGTLFINSRNVGQMKSSQLADLRGEKIGFIFQSFNLIPVLSTYENVEFPLRIQKKYHGKEARDRVESILIDVGLKDYMHRKPNEMSGGQQQRIAVARALVKEPKMVLADEPTANLDSATGNNILEIMHQMNEKKNITFIFSTHDKMVMDFAHRLLKMQDGKIVDDIRNGNYGE